MSITRDGYETTSIGAGDLSIGAVEIKDATIDTRAKVKTDGANNALVVTQNSQPLPAGAAEEAGGNLAAAATVAGAISGAAVVTDADGTIQQYLRGLVTKLIAVQGVTTGAAVITDADGTLQRYLRGLVTLFVARIPVIGTQTAAASMSTTPASDAGEFPVGVKSDETPIDPTVVAATQINGNISTVLNGDANLTAKERYIIEYVTDAPDRMVRGYLKFGGAATIRGGPLLTSMAPFITCLATAKKAYFIRDPLTAFDGYILVHLIS